MHNDCIFCKIIAREVPADIIFEADNFWVIKDKYPNAPIHFLIIPKMHYDDMTQISDDLWIEIKHIIYRIKDDQKLSGFRIVTNAGESAAVKHLHIHFLGGIDSSRGV